MKLKLFFSLVYLITILSCNNKSTQIDTSHTRIQKSIDSVFNQLVTDEIFNGEILVAQENKIIIHKYYGKANLISNEDFTSESVFEIASVSKPFAALAIAKLVSENILSYDDFITKFLPELPYGNIKIKHLVSHTSGLPDYNAVLYPNWDATKIANNQDLLNILIEKPPELLSNPGIEWKYSNIGYTLLAIIVERVQDKTYPQYCKDYIFKPLAMNRTIIPNYEKTKENKYYVNDYIFSFGNAKYIDPSIYPYFDNATFTGDMYGAQGICTGANDLYKFTKIFSYQDILSDSLFKLYTSPQGIKTPLSKDYTLGWFSDTDSIMGESLFYAGGFAGHRSFLEYYKKKETVIIILNNTSAPVWSLRKIITNCLTNQNIEYPKKSYIKMLSYQLQEVLEDRINKKDINDFDSAVYKIRDYEFEELIEELITNNQYDLAIIASEKISEINPDNYKPFFHIGDIKYKIGKIEESLIYFNKALKLNPNDTIIMNRIKEIKNE
ncbi:CubicO group peptidase (beta-lactamase class C family) [Aquimarina sp. MAR_2010_214]|uniref:serine hydrolase n=1 Tax=Aquimarina sp. MAR_2010_214 TaxID=1250026 RepID=UPI000C70C270|nr:serine hydrolase [Aquimarina sp. MAR_2010_214]PKV50915.1 CubicO group peptidase (beta-lactamase class C family) [Aquimarina sp. MAR_2010_214]